MGEVGSETQRLDNRSRRIHWLVRQDRQLARMAVARLANRSECLGDAGVNVCVVEFVLAVVRKKELQRAVYQVIILGIAKRAPYQHRGSGANIGSDADARRRW